MKVVLKCVFRDRFRRHPPASSQISVREEVNVVRLMVLRMQGMLGDVSVEFRTVDGTARSSGKSPPDFVVRTRHVSV